MTGQDRITAILAECKAAGRSSPAGLAWHEFWSWLSAAKPADTPNPPVPLILAASGESDASKHHRLRQQLEWADRHDRLDEAITRLAAIPVEQWNASSLESWNQDSYPPPWHWGWTSDPKPKISAEDATKLIEHLRANWDEVAGHELGRVTSPLRFEGAKRRRLVVRARSDASPPWGSWFSLARGGNRRAFTRFRAAVNAAIKPHEVDHIDFDLRPL